MKSGSTLTFGDKNAGWCAHTVSYNRQNGEPVKKLYIV